MFLHRVGWLNARKRNDGWENLPATSDDCDVIWILLVWVSVLLIHSSASRPEWVPFFSYYAIVRRKLMLLLKRDILVPEEDHAPLSSLAEVLTRTFELPTGTYFSHKQRQFVFLRVGQCTQLDPLQFGSDVRSNLLNRGG